MGSFLTGLGGLAKTVGKGIVQKKKKQVQNRFGLSKTNGGERKKKISPYGIATDMSQSPNQ